MTWQYIKCLFKTKHNAKPWYTDKIKMLELIFWHVIQWLLIKTPYTLTLGSKILHGQVSSIPSAMIRWLLALKAQGTETQALSFFQVVQQSSLHPLLYSYIAGFICPPRTKRRTKLCCFLLCGYANVFWLLGVVLNGRAEEVNKRVWMRGGGQRVKEKLIDCWWGQPMWMQIFI